MAIKKLIEVWNGDNIIEDNVYSLKQQTKEVRLPLSKEIEKIITDLYDTFKKIPCAGIAANQIGYNKKIFIGLKNDDDYDDETNNKDTPIVGNPNAENYEFYINPKIDYLSNKSIQEGEEGCLSIPEIRIITERFDKIKVRYFNSNGKKIKKPLSGFMSKLFQHELDHLNGILMLENSKIKNVYRISENKNVEILYKNLVEKLSKFN